MSTEVELSMGPRRPTCLSYAKDFANMLKAFIGSNYLTIAFAYRQSGIALGLVGVILIASLTAHCCNLLKKCKYHMVSMILGKEDTGSTQADSTVRADYGSGEVVNSASCEKQRTEDKTDLRKHLVRNLNYGDIGRYCFGKKGLAVVNFAIMVTQFGFCVGYCIFIGNTIQSMFPLYNCSLPVTNASKLMLPGNFEHCVQVSSANSYHAKHKDIHNLTETWPEALYNSRTLLGKNVEPAMSPAFSASQSDTQSFWDTDNITVNPDVNSSPPSSIDLSTFSEQTNTLFPSTLSTNSETSRAPYNDSTSTEMSTASDAAVNSTITPLTDVSTLPANSTVSTTASVPWSNMTRWTLTRGDHVIDLRILVVMPIPFFIIFALIRSLRKMGVISLIANCAILLGCGEVLIFLIHGFELSDTYVWINWKGMPIFFGLVTGSFEGIGTILPIEASMEGNRHNFTAYLNGAVSILGLVLTGFGVLGYLRFGDGIEQMINANIPSGNYLNFLVNISLCIGVLLTFPLMLFPVIQLAELLVFGSGQSNIRNKHDEESSGEEQSLLPEKDLNLPQEMGDKHHNISNWKRYLLRTVIVLCAGAFAVLLRNYFAYISAFVGALGSTMLAYILPCLFHLKLCWSHLPLHVKVKDITIIVMGLCFGTAGVYSVIHEIIG